MLPFTDSEELIANSVLPPETLVEVGQDHRLADPEPLKAMLEACERLGRTGERNGEETDTETQLLEAHHG